MSGNFKKIELFCFCFTQYTQVEMTWTDKITDEKCNHDPQYDNPHVLFSFRSYFTLTEGVAISRICCVKKMDFSPRWTLSENFTQSFIHTWVYVGEYFLFALSSRLKTVSTQTTIYHLPRTSCVNKLFNVNISSSLIIKPLKCWKWTSHRVLWIYNNVCFLAFT
jgi:hypothetical protein